jgi:hypothetical protein
MSAAAAGHADAFNLLKRQIGHIDIEDAPGTQRLAA